MIILGPFLATSNNNPIQQILPVSADVQAIALVNASPFLMVAQQAGSYLNMPVPPYTADLFPVTSEASQSINFTFMNLRITSSNPHGQYCSYFIYLFGAQDPVVQQLNNGAGTGYPYSLSGLRDSTFSPAVGGTIGNLVAQNVSARGFSSVLSSSFTQAITDAYLWGFDASLTDNTGTAAHTSFFIQDVMFPGNKLFYAIDSSTTEKERYSVRFPFGLPMTGNQSTNGQNSFGGFQCTFSFPACGNATLLLNVYTSQ